MKHCVIWLLFLLGCPGLLSGAALDKAVVPPVRDADMLVDGRLTEGIWGKSPVYKDFTLLRRSHINASEKTFVQLAASPRGFYLAFRVEDRELKQTVRDYEGPLWHDDALEIFLTPEYDLDADLNVRSGRQFIINSLGVRYDSTFRGGISDSRWNGDWQAAAEVNESGFTAEVFIPFHAFNLQAQQPLAKAPRKWRCNIGRDNFSGDKLEISTWQPTDIYLNMDNFVILELPETDLTAYAGVITELSMAVSSKDGRQQKTVRGKLSGAPAGMKLQAAVTCGGKTAGSPIITAPENGTLFELPVEAEGAGIYVAEIRGFLNGGQVLYHQGKIHFSNVPFQWTWKNPVYRRTIFADQADKMLRITGEFPDSTGTAVLKIRQDGKTAAEIYRHPAAKVEFKLNCAALPPGKYNVTLRVDGNLPGELSETLTVLPPPAAGNTVRLNNERRLVVNGEPFFTRGFLGGSAETIPVVAAAGSNILHFYMMHKYPMEEIMRILNLAQEHGIKIMMCPWYGFSSSFWGFKLAGGGKLVTKLDQASWDKIEVLVNAVKEHPAFLGWYLYDEPRGADYCSELAKAYAFLKVLDPHHPVWGLDCSSDGCLEKRDKFCDIHILDLYPNPKKTGGFKRTPAVIAEAMLTVSENIGGAGAWYCPQAFDGSSFNPPEEMDRPLTYTESRCIIYAAIVNGATGITPYKIGQPELKYYEHNSNSGIFFAPDLKIGYLEGILPELKGLEKVLLSSTQKRCPPRADKLLCRTIQHNGKNYLIAVNTSGKGLNADIPWQGNGAVKVINENRIIQIGKQGFKEYFEPYAVHIYTDDPEWRDTLNTRNIMDKIRDENTPQNR